MTTRGELPTELDRLDPPPRPPRAPRRRKGEAETAVLQDLKEMPERLRKSSVAAMALLLARQLDEGGTIPRETADHVRKLARRLEDSDMTLEDAAAALLLLARYIEGGMTMRDSAGHVRETRMCMTQLREWNPAGVQGDATGEARAQMESTRALYAVPGA